MIELVWVMTVSLWFVGQVGLLPMPEGYEGACPP